LAAELKKDLKLDAQLIEGSRGIFDVKADGKMVFSKYETGRFPNPGEVSALLSKSAKP